MKRLKGNRMLWANVGLSCIAVAVSNFFNVTGMRYKEILGGVKVYSQDRKICYGNSLAAGKQAVFQTAFGRMWIPVPAYVFPVLV